MKICVCSDSHGRYERIEGMLLRERPDALLFLGDGERDIYRLDIPLPEVYAVCGNCDIGSSLPPSRSIELAGKRIFMTHGHYYNVKRGLSELRAMCEGHDAVLYGHTHRQYEERCGDSLILCPGSLFESAEAYAVLEIRDGELSLSYGEKTE